MFSKQKLIEYLQDSESEEDQFLPSHRMKKKPRSCSNYYQSLEIGDIVSQVREHNHKVNGYYDSSSDEASDTHEKV